MCRKHCNAWPYLPQCMVECRVHQPILQQSLSNHMHRLLLLLLLLLLLCSRSLLLLQRHLL